MEIGLKRGTCCAANSMESVTSRMEGRGGEMYFFCAMYSFRMSFCSVPEIFCHETPCCSATARYIAQMMDAGELMVIETVTAPSGMSANNASISARDEIATPHLPTS